MHITPEDSDDPIYNWQFLNHSCLPNCYIHFEEMVVVSLRGIQEGEELTFDYNTTEFELSHPFECNCKAEDCLQDIRGFKFLTDKERKKRSELLATYLLS